MSKSPRIDALIAKHRAENEDRVPSRADSLLQVRELIALARQIEEEAPRPEEPLLKPLTAAALEVSDALHRFEAMGKDIPLDLDNAWGNLTVILEQCRPQKEQ